MRALQSLGYDATSLDYDEHFVENVRELKPDVVFNALARSGRRRRSRSGVARVPGDSVYGQRGRSFVALDGQASDEETACGRRLADRRVGSLRFQRRHAAAAARIARSCRWSSNRGSKAHAAASRSFAPTNSGPPRCSRRRRCIRRFSRRSISRDASSLAPCSVKRRFRSSRSSPTATSSTSFDAKYEPGGSTHIAPAPIDDDLAARLQMLALSAHRSWDLRDYSRTDFIVSRDCGRTF